MSSKGSKITGGTLLDVRYVGAIPVAIYEVAGLKDENDDPQNGLHDEGEWAVYVDAGLSPLAKSLAIVHEMIHLISWFHGLGLSENKTRAIEMSFCQAFPELQRLVVDEHPDTFYGPPKRDPAAGLKC